MHRYHYQACTADMLVVEDNDGNTLSFSCLAFLHCSFSNGIMMAMHYLSGAHVRVHDLNIWHLTSWAGPQFQSLALRSAPTCSTTASCPLTGSCLHNPLFRNRPNISHPLLCMVLSVATIQGILLIVCLSPSC